jgi:diacylglycerol kinase (ATP)
MLDFSDAKWMFIVNPAAANGRAGKIWKGFETLIRTKLSNLTIVQTQYTGHAIQLAEEAILTGFRHLIAVGGDGTNHEVTNGILRQKLVPTHEIFYTLLPIGTGNDWIRTHRIPRNIIAWLTMIEDGYYCQQEVGLVEYWLQDQPRKRYFVNVAGMAYDAFVVRFGEQHRSWVRNRFFYLLLILRCLFKYRLTQGIIKTEKQSINQKLYTINIGICRYSGGGMQLVPQAKPDDGLLALTYAGPVSKLGVLLNTWRFYNGSLGQHPKITTTQAKNVLVTTHEADPPIPLEADGEFLGYSPASFTIKERALTVIVPRPV